MHQINWHNDSTTMHPLVIPLPFLLPQAPLAQAINHHCSWQSLLQWYGTMLSQGAPMPMTPPALATTTAISNHTITIKTTEKSTILLYSPHGHKKHNKSTSKHLHTLSSAIPESSFHCSTTDQLAIVKFCSNCQSLPTAPGIQPLSIRMPSLPPITYCPHLPI